MNQHGRHHAGHPVSLATRLASINQILVTDAGIDECEHKELTQVQKTTAFAIDSLAYVGYVSQITFLGTKPT